MSIAEKKIKFLLQVKTIRGGEKKNYLKNIKKNSSQTAFLNLQIVIQIKSLIPVKVNFFNKLSKCFCQRRLSSSLFSEITVK